MRLHILSTRRPPWPCARPGRGRSCGASSFCHACDFKLAQYFVLIDKKIIDASEAGGDDICINHYKLRCSMRNLQGKVAFVTGGSAASAPPSSGGWRPTARTWPSPMSAHRRPARPANWSPKSRPAAAGRWPSRRMRQTRISCAAPPNERWMSWGRSTCWSITPACSSPAIWRRPAWTTTSAPWPSTSARPSSPCRRCSRPCPTAAALSTSAVADAGRAGVTIYAASKSALLGLTRGLARDLGPRGITVNVVHPGPIDTDMNPADGERAGDMVAVLSCRTMAKRGTSPAWWPSWPALMGAMSRREPRGGRGFAA